MIELVSAMRYGARGSSRVGHSNLFPALNVICLVKLGKKPLFCQFNVDIFLEEHKVPQVCMLENVHMQ